jgi:hypothetical protein
MIRNRLTFSNVMSFLALFVALSAGSYAAISLPKNSVGSKQLKAKAVTNAKLASNSVSAPKIQANAVDASKVKDGSLTGSDINLGTLGKVPLAAAADTAGAASIARAKIVTAPGSATPGSGTPGVATATCDAGLVVVGGGANVADPTTEIINDSYPSSASSWTADVFSGGGTGFTVYAICAPAAATS